MFEIKRVSKKYENEYVLKDLNFNIGRGLNFIIGASGSGKTTLLKIITGMEKSFEGNVLFLEESIKNLTDSQKAYYYNNKFGLVWQDFNLIEDMTVEENILLPLYLKNVNNEKELEKQLKALNIVNLRNEKIKNLSGGQKQRVAIARELIKNPQVLIADEPTSALDRKTALEVMKILKEVAKERTVIIVTHDTSLIEKDSKVYELDKGELIKKPEELIGKIQKKKATIWKPFKLSDSFKVSLINNKNKKGRVLISCIGIIISSILLITGLGGSFSKKGDETFNQLYDAYGKSILDLMVVKSFTGAESTGEKENKPNVDVEQDISGIYDKYINDERVEFLLFDKSISQIKVQADGKEYNIEQSNNVPIVNEILVGDIPRNKNEVLVPEALVKKMGIDNKEAIGKEIDLSGKIVKWKDKNNPEEKNIDIKVKIVGVGDSKLRTEYEGKSFEYELEDSFFFDKETIEEMNRQADITDNNHNFKIRTKTPEDLIEIKNELNAEGIVPIGFFELLEDIVNLNLQTKTLSEGSMKIIGALAIVGIFTITLIMAIMRRKEYAIYKICGYSNKQLNLIIAAENIILGAIAIISVTIMTPVIYMLTSGRFGMVIGKKGVFMSIFVTIIIALICYGVEALIGKKSEPLKILKSGVR